MQTDLILGIAAVAIMITAAIAADMRRTR